MKTADLCRKHGISEASFYNFALPCASCASSSGPFSRPDPFVLDQFNGATSQVTEGFNKFGTRTCFRRNEARKSRIARAAAPK